MPLPLTARIEVLPVRGGEEMLHRVFEPLGYTVVANRHVLDERFPEWGPSPYFSVTLEANKTLAEETHAKRIHDSIMRMSVANSPVARSLQLSEMLAPVGGKKKGEGAEPASWEMVPGNVNGIYNAIILPEFRANKDPRLLDYWDMVIKGESDLGETSTTDGTLASQGLVVLEDDKHIQPAQNLVPAVSSEFLSAHPDIADILNPLMAALTTENLTALNEKVSVDRQKPEDVAKQFLDDNGLL